MNITEADRTTARRIIRRFAGVPERSAVKLTCGSGTYIGRGMRFVSLRDSRSYVKVSRDVFDVASLAAAQGRAYAAALRSAK